MKIGEIIRQGDVFLVYAGEVEDVDKASGRLTVAHGESGHQHVLLEAQVLSGDDLAWQLFAKTGEWSAGGVPLVNIPKQTEMQHEDHDAHVVPAGVYQVVRMREYDYETAYARAMMD